MAITNAQQYKQILQKVREEKAFGGVMGLDGRRAYVGGSYGGGYGQTGGGLGGYQGLGDGKDGKAGGEGTGIDGKGGTGGDGGGGERYQEELARNQFEINRKAKLEKEKADIKAKAREDARIEQERIKKTAFEIKEKARLKAIADKIEKEKRREKIISLANIPTPFNIAKKIGKKIFSPLTNIQRQKYIDTQLVPGTKKYTNFMEQLVDQDAATINVPDFQQLGYTTGDLSKVDFDDGSKFGFGEGYDNYRDTIDTRFNTDGPGDNDGSNQLPPIISQQPITPVTPLPVVGPTTSSDPFSLAPRFMGSTFDFSDDYGRTLAADGGRIGAQQGGIMPRLNELSGSVSSAEEMLQEINQRLDSAESTLGEGVDGGGSMFDRPQLSREESGFNFNFNTNTNNQKPFSPISGSIQNQMQNSFGMRRPASPIRQQRGFDFNRLIDAGVADPVRNKPIYAFGAKPAIPFADGGRTLAADGGMMMMRKEYRDLLEEDEMDDPTGGIMDLETGRQQYFLGKLVKKATRAVKKVAKSPIGKAALLYGLGSLGASALGKANTGTGFFSNFFTKKNPLLFSDGKFSVGKATSLGLGIPFALDALGVGKEEEDGVDLDSYYASQGLDINKYRYGNFLAPRFQGSTFAADGGLMRTGYQEGGDAEPVAKKTMPLLDMDGQEMDLREEGGFVPLGRMERADDVPARLSKNEFVFTADAVRNAGEGDIDKGAEVMYNMRKNLESGGEVSEESQGLEGAREMFQTSQRLEEVL